MLPSPLEVAELIKGNEIIELTQLKQTNHIMAMKKVSAKFFGKPSLSTSFDLFFSDSDQLLKKIMSSKTETFDELLLLCTFFNEVKDHSKLTDGDVF